MRASIFTSNHRATLALVCLAALGATLLPRATFAQATPPATPPASSKSGPSTQNPEDEDYSPNPYTGYAEFDQQGAEEEADMNFFKYGRFFGLSLGTGFQDAFGNRGKLWNGGFPGLEFKAHVWLDLQIAISLGVYISPHNYFVAANSTAALDGSWDVKFSRYTLDLRYYIDTRDLSAALTFANPYILGSVGSFNKTETNASQNLKNKDSALGLGVGLGMEFPISPKKLYFTTEGRISFANFDDNNTTIYKGQGLDPSLDNLKGAFYTLTLGFLFTW